MTSLLKLYRATHTMDNSSKMYSKICHSAVNGQIFTDGKKMQIISSASSESEVLFSSQHSLNQDYICHKQICNMIQN